MVVYLRWSISCKNEQSALPDHDQKYNIDSKKETRLQIPASRDTNLALRLSVAKRSTEVASRLLMMRTSNSSGSLSSKTGSSLFSGSNLRSVGNVLTILTIFSFRIEVVCEDFTNVGLWSNVRPSTLS